MAKRKISIIVQKWNSEMTCPKCLRCEADGEMPYEPFQLVSIEATPVMMIVCRTCGFNWLMETADAQ